ncbi:MAG: hypothetical protein H3Z52_06195, partial [archaeon]|nr:hypothetical protein [archaeon]
MKKIKKFEIPIAKIRLPIKHVSEEELKHPKKVEKIEPEGLVSYCPNCKEIYVKAKLPNNLCVKCKQPLDERFLIHLWKLGAEYVGKRGLIKAMIAGESEPKAFHPIIEARCSKCNSKAEADLVSQDALRALVSILARDLTVEQIMRDSLPIGGCVDEGQHFWIVEETGDPQDYRELFLRDIIGLEEMAERSVTARNYKAFIIGKPPSEKKALVDAEVVVAPKTNELTLLIKDVTPIGELGEEFKLTDEDIKKLKQFQELNFEGTLNLSDIYIAPQIVGRAFAKLCSLLTASSVTWIKIGFITERGCLRCLFIGDPRVGKGSIVESYSENMKIGEHGMGEAASRAGLLYFVDPESNTLIWGLLVQADLGLVAVEGLHGLPSEQLAEFREALHNMRVEVSKKVSGSAWARVRILADGNTPIPMANEVYPALAITKVRCLQDPIDVTRWDLMMPFASTDVSPEKIAEGG